VVWLIRERVAAAARSAGVMRAVVFASCVGLAVWVAPRVLPPKIPAGGTDRLYVMGDSLGLGPGGRGTWPRLLEDLTSLKVSDLTEPGQPLRRARRRTAFVQESPSVVLLSLGGCDIVDGIEVDQFESLLRYILIGVGRPTRTLVMIELPLRPFQNQYGAAQRELAREYGAVLIPKRVLAWAMYESNARFDSYELGPAGHKALAEALAAMFDKHELAGSP
jgi:hypothetical protein